MILGTRAAMEEKASRFATSAGSEEIELAADPWEQYENCDSNDLEDTDFVPKNLFRSSKESANTEKSTIDNIVKREYIF